MNASFCTDCFTFCLWSEINKSSAVYIVLKSTALNINDIHIL
jgi:hypothetical protein